MASKKTYLFVDDSRISRMKIRQLVSQQRPEWELIEATSGEEALQKILGASPDLISVDINMPGMNGLEAVALLRESCPEARIVIVSGNIQESMQKKAAELGARFVEKPISEASIAKVLAAVEG